MRIAILGAGRVGATAARLFVRAGHGIAICNSRGPESLQTLIAELGTRAHATTVNDAVGFGELVLLAVPWHAQDALPPADRLRGKIVIDAMNAFKPGGGVWYLGECTSSEIVIAKMQGARLVKTFNAIYYKDLAQCSRNDLPVPFRRAIYLAGDDKEAKEVVAGLIEEIGFAPVDTGSLRDGGRLQEPDSAIFYQTFSGFEAEQFLQTDADIVRVLTGSPMRGDVDSRQQFDLEKSSLE